MVHQCRGLSSRLPRRAAAGAERVFQVEAAGGLADPARMAEGRSAVDAATKGLEFLGRLRLVDLSRPAARAVDGRLSRQVGRILQTIHPEARPRPVFGGADELGAERVALDVGQDAEQVRVLLNREGAEAALPDVAATAMAAVVAADVAGEQPLHESAEVAIAAGPEDEVEVIGHQAEGGHAHGQALAAGGEQVEKGAVVGLVVEDAGAAVAAIDDVIADAADGCPSGSRHGASVRGGMGLSRKVECPPADPKNRVNSTNGEW